MGCQFERQLELSEVRRDQDRGGPLPGGDLGPPGQGVAK